MKAVISVAEDVSANCQYPEVRYNTEMTLEPKIESILSSMSGIG